MSFTRSSVTVLASLTTALTVGLAVQGPARSADQIAPVLPQQFTLDVGTFHTAMIAGDGTPWAVGNNSTGRLCTGDTDNRTVFTPMIGFPSDRRAVQVRVERDRSIVLDDLGVVRGCGTGLGTSLVVLPGIPAGRKVVDLAAGRGHLVVLLDDGRVLGRGDGTQGQISGTQDQTSFIEVAGLPSSLRAVDIAAGDNFTLVLDELGGVRGTGFNNDGQLGAAISVFNQLVELQGKPAGVEVVQVAAGRQHSLIVGSNGRVYGLGRNADGQLATGAATARETSWVRLRGADDVVWADGGDDHTVVLTSAGTPLTTGDNTNATQGRAEGGRNLELTEFGSHPFDYSGPAFSQIAAGGDSTVARDRHGYHFGAGSNGWNQLRSTDTLNVDALRRGFPQVVRAVSGATISGVPLPGRTLTSGRGVWSPSTGLGYQYVWKRDGVVVQSGPGQTYQVVAQDAGRTLTVDVFGFLTSHINDDVLTTAPLRVSGVNLVRPSLTGAVRVGGRVSTNRGSWNAPGYTFTVQWLRSGAAIRGATSTSYVLKAADRGRQVAVRVTARKAGYPTIVVSSVSKVVKR